MSELILLRHGQSTYNLSNTFTGWIDVDLTEKGVEEAESAGLKLLASGIQPDILLTSVLKRAIYTAEIALRALDRSWIPVIRSWRLNERHYGALQHLNKAETAKRFGDEQVKLWRRSYDVPPPPTTEEEALELAADPRYRGLTMEQVPRTESLKDVLARVLPFWEAEVVPLLAAGHTILVSAHGNSLRAMVKHIEGIPDEEIVGYEIANGEPIIYTFSEGLEVTEKLVL